MATNEVREVLSSLTYSLDGPIGEAIKTLQREEEYYAGKFLRLELDFACGYGDDAASLDLVGYRPENAAERSKRTAAEVVNTRERAQREKAEYVRLRQKYGKKG